ncbi:hypothetical protein K469DRAFT_290600 [Zopfia rhizophila CBS 207.26]|uniref:Uncharacterized protein n=1 Tax=Zopfia rhizophila CBS 207.26 TaxID=1314779 RepID=A0A6A6DPB9_9PEZI|nr:hypothetical protein K469DRAFT_290600 [Zopfia rhizophila CBS 207.26]
MPPNVLSTLSMFIIFLCTPFLFMYSLPLRLLYIYSLKLYLHFTIYQPRIHPAFSSNSLLSTNPHLTNIHRKPPPHVLPTKPRTETCPAVMSFHSASQSSCQGKTRDVHQLERGLKYCIGTSHMHFLISHLSKSGLKAKSIYLKSPAPGPIHAEHLLQGN